MHARKLIALQFELFLNDTYILHGNSVSFTCVISIHILKSMFNFYHKAAYNNRFKEFFYSYFSSENLTNMPV